MELSKEFYHKGRNLPHFHKGRKIHFITFRLADSLPQVFLSQLKIKIESLDKDKQDIIYRKRIEEWLNQGIGNCLLRQKKYAQFVVDVWKFYEQKDYDLLAWVVMPNHVHVLLNLYDSANIGKVIRRWKSYSAYKINNIKNSTGEIWMNDYYDRFIRDRKHLENTLSYIRKNINTAGILWSVPESIYELEKNIDKMNK
ncbi:MAG: transposase [Akkermansia sp.]|nr:transposase [Akkermansia sp.]